MSEEQKAISVENLVGEDLINRDFFLELLGAIGEKKRILLVGQPGAHGLTTLVMTLLIHGDTRGYRYEIFDSSVVGDVEGHAGKQYLAHLHSDEDVYGVLSLWANGASGVATIYAGSVREALDRMEGALKKREITDTAAFVNFTVDVICMVENEGEDGENSVVRDVIVQHH